MISKVDRYFDTQIVFNFIIGSKVQKASTFKEFHISSDRF